MKKSISLLLITCFFAINSVNGRKIFPPGSFPGIASPPTEVIKNAIVAPLNYTIKVRPILDDGYEGLPVDTAQIELKVRVRALENSNEIELVHKNLRLNLDGVRVTNVSDGSTLSIQQQTDEPVKAKPSPYDDHPPLPPNSVYKIQLENAFNKGDLLEISIPYQVSLTEAIHHPSYSILLPSTIGFDNYTDNNETKKFAVSTLEKYNTRDVLPVFETRNDKATFKIIIGRIDGKYESLSNMDLDYTEPDPSNADWVWDHYKETVPLYPHQLFMLVSDLSNNTVETGNQRVSVWSTTSYQQKHGITIEYISEIASKLMQYYSKILNTPFPSKKLNILRLPTRSSYNAENFGVILLNGGNDPIVEEEISNKSLAIKISEEIARQWVGSILSVQCFKCQYETHLETELLVYLKHLGVLHIMPDYPVHELFDLDSAIFRDKTRRVRIKMLEEIFGVATIASALGNLISSKKFKVATDQDFYDSLDLSLKENNATDLLPSSELKGSEIIPDWLVYSPEIIVKITDQGGKLVLAQETFDSFGSFREDNRNISYWTPVILKTDDGKTHKLWLPKNGSSVTYEGVDTSKWVFANPTGVFPYVTMYSMNNIKAISNQLLENHNVFSTGARIKLMNDYTLLSQLGRVPIDEVLTLSKYLHNETDDSVWRIAIDKLINLMVENMKEHDEEFQSVQQFFAPKMQKLVERIGLDTVRYSYPYEKVCLALAVPACVERANQHIKNWKMNQVLSANQAFPYPGTSELVICAAIENSKDATTWGFILNKYLTYNDTNTFGRYTLIKGLACQHNLTLVKTLLDQSVTMDEATQKDIYSNFAVNSKVSVKQTLYEFLKEKVSSKMISPETFAYAIGQLQFCDRGMGDLRIDLVEFMKTNSEVLQNVKSELDAHLPVFSGSGKCFWWDSVGDRITKWLSNEV